MSCNSCAKSYSLLRKEKGCPSCGFSYCSKCLGNKVFVPKLNAEAKVCAKCMQSPTTDENAKIIPPDAYYKRIAAMDSSMADSSSNSKDQEILKRLQKLKKETSITSDKGSNDDIANRLQAIKGEVPSVSNEELQMRLNKLRGQQNLAAQNKPILSAPDTRTEQEQANDLLKQYMEQTKIDSTYNDGFNDIINDIETRMQKLKGTKEPQNTTQSQETVESEDEEETIKKIIEKVKAESLLEDNATPQLNDELPFCEICNEDATMRCLGCKYLFCKRCFLDHKDDDDGCDRYEPYQPPNIN